MANIKYCAICGHKASVMDNELCNSHAVWMKGLLRDYRESQSRI